MKPPHTQIHALEYDETCGDTHIASGILMVDMSHDGTYEEICRLTKGTIREKQIAILWQGAERLLHAATMVDTVYREGATLEELKEVIEELKGAVDYALTGDFFNN